MRARRTTATIALGAVVLAACGPGSADSPVAAPAAGPPSPAEARAPSAESDITDVAELPVVDPPTDELGSSADRPPDAAPAGASTPESEPNDEPSSVTWPDDRCSADNSPTPVAAADGPPPILELRAESVDSPLPDLAVRRINCSGGWENLRNELPSDRPLLVWFWAPH